MGSLTQDYFEIVLLIYGFTFFIFSTVIYVLPQEEKTQFPLFANLPLLAAFGVVHGVHEFVEWAIYNYSSSLPCLKWLSRILLLISYVPLFEFGRRLFYNQKCSKVWDTLYVYGFVCGLAFAVLIFDNGLANAVMVIARLLLGLPGGVLAGLAVLSYAKKETDLRLKFHLGIMGKSVVLYGAVSGILPDSDSVFAGLSVNYSTFLAVLHIPVQVVRAMAIAVATIALTRAVRHINETTRQQEVIARLQAEKASHAKSEFLSRMSHELRTPLNAILGFAQLLEDENLNEEQRDDVHEILAAGRHLLELINEILDLSKIEAQKISFNYTVLSLNDLVAGCVALLQPVAAANKITLLDKISSTETLMVYADELRLKQVVFNLTSNAIKYNRAEGIVTLSCECTDKNTVRVNVTDTGIGVSEQQIHKLFQPFERLNAKQQIEGTGIGLCISKKLIEAMGGRIGVNSTVGKGSCFWIEAPLA